MKKLTASLAVILLAAGISFAGGKLSKPHISKPHLKTASKSKAFTGEIMDSQCAMMGSHAQMEKMKNMPDDSKMCTVKCVEMGGKYVLYDGAKKATYMLDDQEKPKEFAGQKVKVTGTLDKATKTIKVENIEAGS